MSRSDTVRLFASTCLVSLALGSAAAAPVRTAEVTEGPFYPFNSTNTLPTITPANRDNDMTRVTGAATPARGLPFLLSGVVRDLAGAPVAGV